MEWFPSPPGVAEPHRGPGGGGPIGGGAIGGGSPAVPRVSPAGYWIGGVLILGGLAVAVVWFVVTVVGVLNAP
ncbi:MAG: hypothetical protein WHS89_02215, partial [Acidimicrobiales bacterium]